MLATDAGARHFGVAYDLPIVTIIGPTDPRYSESNSDRSVILRIEDLECSPCHLRKCPLVHHACMTWIETEQVIEACEEQLRRFPPSPRPESEVSETD